MESVAMTISCPPQSESKVSLLQTTPTEQTEQGEVKLETR